MNDTRVVPARLLLRRETGGAVELLLLERLDGANEWEALARPSRRLRVGERLRPCNQCHKEERSSSSRGSAKGAGSCGSRASRTARYRCRRTSTSRRRIPSATRPSSRDEAGSAAAPTAGLHFSRALLDRVDHVAVTLHVGLDTFRPLTEETVEEHAIHGERYRVDPGAWARIDAAERVLAVGTTTTRVVETLARGAPLEGRTELYITPGFAFRRVDALLTNFHLPRTTLLALVMAFAGVEETRRLYAAAIEERYRFYSFGDAMLVL